MPSTGRGRGRQGRADEGRQDLSWSAWDWPCRPIVLLVVDRRVDPAGVRRPDLAVRVGAADRLRGGAGRGAPRPSRCWRSPRPSASGSGTTRWGLPSTPSACSTSPWSAAPPSRSRWSGSGGSAASPRCRRSRRSPSARSSRPSPRGSATSPSPRCYQSAAQGALVGGDLYDCYHSEDRVRLVVGDVRGKGIAGVEQAARVIRAFRQSAALRPTLAEVACEMDDYLAGFFGEEEFVTALLVDVTRARRAADRGAGHPPPELVGADVAVAAGPPARAAPGPWPRRRARTSTPRRSCRGTPGTGC